MHGRTREIAPGILSRGFLLAVATLVFACPAWADVTLKEKTVSSGMMGFGNGTSERTTVIAGDKSRSDEQNTYTGRFQTFAGGGKPRGSVQIIRLDREVFWTLDPEKKQYTELTFADMRQMMEAGMSEMQSQPKDPRAKDVEFDYTVDVKRTGKKDRINGFNAEQFILTLTATPKDTHGGQAAGGYTMTMDEWLSTEVPGGAEVQAFHRRMGEKLGLDPEVQRFGMGAMAMYRDAMKQLAEKMKEMKGYPVRTTLTVGMGPASATTTVAPAAEQRAQADQARANARDERDRQRKERNAREDANATEGAANSALRGNLGGAMSGLLGHGIHRAAQNHADASVDSAEAKRNRSGSSSTTPGGLTITTDVLSVTTGAVAASYDVPPDYKKVERKQK